MIHATIMVPVNPAGEPPLTREQAWQGLVLKARDARHFLMPGSCTRCDVIQEGEGYIIREATIRGNDITEIVTFEPESKVSFHQVKGPREGVIVNELHEEPDGALHFRVYCLLGLKGVESGGPEEMHEQAMFADEHRGYKAGLYSTLKRTRLLAAEGKL
jgi:hypothetical protein